MNLTDEEVIQRIKQHKFIIITGTTDGRTRMRKLILKNLGPKRIINTRRYFYYRYRDTILYPHKTLIIIVENYEDLVKSISFLTKKRRPVIIDSFTDIQRMIVDHFKETSDGDFTATWNWPLIIQQELSIITTLKKYKKQLILFCDLRADRAFQKGELKTRGYRPDIHSKIIILSDLVIQATDKDNLLVKEKPTPTLEDVMEVKK
jgi:hypothetical protein